MQTRGDDEEPADDEGLPSDRASSRDPRDWVSQGFSWLEDIVYIGLGILLGASALVLLATIGFNFARELLAGALSDRLIDFLDRILLVLIFVEVLYTVEVSFRERVLSPEPFLIIALIAGIRRILVLTAGIAELLEQDERLFRNAMFELALLTVLTVALVLSLVILRRPGARTGAERGASSE